MRIATGVLLIIAAVFNLFGSFGYFAGGGLASAGSDITTELTTQMANTATATEEEKLALQQSSEMMDSMSNNSALWTAMGVLMIVSVGILIAGAVFLFMNKSPTFILVSGGVAILVEVLGIVLIAFGIMNIIGLIAGVLAIVCGVQMRKSLNPV